MKKLSIPIIITYKKETKLYSLAVPKLNIATSDDESLTSLFINLGYMLESEYSYRTTYTDIPELEEIIKELK